MEGEILRPKYPLTVPIGLASPFSRFIDPKRSYTYRNIRETTIGRKIHFPIRFSPGFFGRDSPERMVRLPEDTIRSPLRQCYAAGGLLSDENSMKTLSFHTLVASLPRDRPHCFLARSPASSVHYPGPLTGHNATIPGDR